MDQDLLRFKRNQKYILFDFETENLNLYYNKPWQLAYLIAEGPNIIETKDYYLWWEDLNVSPAAAAITRFNYFRYKERAVDPRPILDEFEAYLNDPEYIVLFHNGLSFDCFIHSNFRRLLGETKPNYGYLNRCIDTHLIAKAYKLGLPPPEDKSNFLAWQYKLNSIRQRGLRTNLKTLGEEFGIEHDYSRLHDAVVDISLNYKVFQQLIWKVEL